MAIYLSNLKYLVSDMRANKIDLSEFEVKYQRYKFRCILDIGASPYELLIGAIDTNWAAVIYLKKGYEAEMADKDFYKLCDLLELKPGGGVFTSYMFLKYISNHAPHKCKRRIVDPMYLVRYRQYKIKDSDEPWKIYFKGWNNHVLDKKTARNFDKTEKLLGKRVADYCREHNISSMWSDKTSEKKKVTYPW